MAFRCFAPESSLIGQVGFPIRISLDHSSIANSPTLFAGLHVLLRLSSPRHPPDALIHLTLSFEVPLTSWLERWLSCPLGYSTLIKLTALLCHSLPFVFKEWSIQSSPNSFNNACECFKLLEVFSTSQSFSRLHRRFHCLLISAFQFVKELAIFSSNRK